MLEVASIVSHWIQVDWRKAFAVRFAAFHLYLRHSMKLKILAALLGFHSIGKVLLDFLSDVL
jgi:hypothetical protein